MQEIIQWLQQRLPLFFTLVQHFRDYYVPKQLNFYYVFGAIALILLVNQFLSGFWLTMFYTPSAQEAFQSVESLMREVNYGWLLRYLHSTGASAFFIVLYLHVFKALLYGSYQKPRELLWIIGVCLLFLIYAEAFAGYVLPWGQLSYWALQVMTSLIESIPYIGETMALWIRGDYVSADATLHRVFAFHVVGLPLLFIILIALHLVALHQVGSNNPEGTDVPTHASPEGMPFYPHYLLKDTFGVLVFLIVFSCVVFFIPDGFGFFLEPANFIAANPLVTPEEIVPVWYLTPWYAMLKTIPHKGIGITTVMASLLILFFLPWLDKSSVRSMKYKGNCSKLTLLLWVSSLFILGYIGRTPLLLWKQYLGWGCIGIYFSYFLLMPFYTKYEPLKLYSGGKECKSAGMD